MRRNKLIDMIGSLSEKQVERLCVLATEYLDLNAELEDTTPKNCPCCMNPESRFIKKGFSGRKQRYQCKSCGKKFTYDAGKITAFSHQSEEKWVIFIQDTVSLKSIDECAFNISVSHPTAFYMRHKLLSFLEKVIIEDHILEGIIEADETYLPESNKGIRVTTRKPRKHGEPALKSGLSSVQFCICFATDRDSHIIARCVNRARPSAEHVKTAIGSRLGEGSVFVCDDARPYNRLIDCKHCEKIVLNSHKKYNKVYHLNTVNGLHNRFKEMIRRYRGVSSKYLNRYLALFTALEQVGRSIFHPEADSIRRSISQVMGFYPIRSLQHDGILQI